MIQMIWWRAGVVLPILLVMGLCLPTGLRAQHEDDVWLFTQGYAVDFSGGAPVALDPVPLNTYESACVSDRNTGALLFYSDGLTVYNRDHLPMVNGDSLNAFQRFSTADTTRRIVTSV